MRKLPKHIDEAVIVEELRKALTQLPGMEVYFVDPKQSGRDDGIDAEIITEVQGRPVRLLVQVKKTGYPRDIRQDVWRIAEQYRDDPERPVVPLIAAPAISPGSRSFLRQERVGYFDLGGSFYLPLSWAFYYVDRPAPKELKDEVKGIYRGRMAQVLHLLLTQPERGWHVNELASEAEVSLYTAHRALTTLEKQLWVERRGTGPESIRVLREPGHLLDSWAENYSHKQFSFQNYYKWTKSPHALRQSVTDVLENYGVEYALTLSSGAELVSPFASAVDRLHVIVPSSARFENIIQHLNLKPVNEGPNVTFMVTKQRAPLLARQRAAESWVASDVQLYLDLWIWPARGKEQAEHLRAERLKF